ncbi:MAG: CHAT domain-containing protein [Lyngbya sp.]|nr:CHAT domain-containing protein [Lyngbya sp.]
MTINQLFKTITLIGILALIPSSALAQITPANDGTGTRVTPAQPGQNTQTRFDIQGGSRSQDGANLFHSFEQFNLDAGQTANFIATPEIRNILTRIVGGDVSNIDGIIQVTGSNANLFLMNPSGIVFGANASLNVPASFFATTSTAIGLGEFSNGISQTWFEAFQANNYSQLNGSPNAFVLSNNPSGVIINNGNLTVQAGNTLGLIGNSVVNQGTVSAPQGNVLIESVPGNGLVRISQAGNLLSLEVQSEAISNPLGTPIVALPKLLTGGIQTHATNVIVNDDNTITLTDSNASNTVERRARSTRFDESINLETSPFNPSFTTPITVTIPSEEISAPVRPFNINNIADQTSFLPVLPIEPIPLVENPNDPQISYLVDEIPNIEQLILPTSSEINQFIEAPSLSISPELVSPTINNLEQSINLHRTNLDYPIINPQSLQSLIPSHLNPENNYLISLQSISTETTIQEVLSGIEAQTSQKPAVIYIKIRSNHSLENSDGLKIKTKDGLSLMLVLPNGKSIVKSIPEADLQKLNRLAREFYWEVSDPKTTAWPAARKLYEWFIAPLEAELKEAGIDTLLFCLDERLRSLPLAALHDGKQFLIEKYNFSLIPSLNLTDVSYQGLQDAEVLAMGMSEFEDQPSLPSVPTEVATITQKLWPGETLLNQEFTLENLRRKRNQKAFKIIHLATHANFISQQDSYIQFWDDKLPLDRLRELKWYKQPQVELLVLSACKTALGNVEEAETEMGFAGLAYRAGVKSALASLWRVSDVGTLGLMVEFYAQLKSSPIKAEALRQAQLALLRGEVRMEGDALQQTRGTTPLPPILTHTQPTQQLSHPYYWAGFTMIGSPW